MGALLGKLFIVSTPIGNLRDITYRAIEVLNNVQLIAAEDTRHSKKLLCHYNISTPMISYFEHNRFKRIPKIIERLNQGGDIALITDAGTPGISDPAYKRIRESIINNIIIESIPGASASLAALVSSGLPTDKFLFEGFLPVKKGRRKKINSVKDVEATLIYYESPKRIQRTLKHLLEELGDRPAVVARELTKIHEEIKRGTLSELLLYFTTKPPKGECVILIGKDDKNVYF